MKKMTNLFVLLALVSGFALSGCSGDVKEKGAADEDSKTSPEAQKIIDSMQGGGMKKKQFGDKADKAPQPKTDEN